MRMRLVAAFLLLLAFRVSGFADTVYLVNGRTFEGVIAETTDGEVRIVMPGGSLSLPSSRVLRVEKSASQFAEYLERKKALARSGAGAAAWLELARWAKTGGLAQGMREAALTAADLDPRLEGLAPLLRGYGYVLDEQLDRWIPYADAMRRKGLVQWNGEWISRHEQAARQLLEQEEIARRNAERAAARMAQVTQATREAELALAQMELRQRISQSSAGTYTMPVYVYPWYVLPLPASPCRHHCGPQDLKPPMAPTQRDGEAQRDARESFTHVPGSLIPGRLGPPMSSSSSAHR